MQKTIGDQVHVLSDHVSTQARYSRSANLERDVDCVEPLDGYVVTSLALDVVKRVADVAQSAKAGGAWSLVGPYGSGKSSLALLIDAAFGPKGSKRSLALSLIDKASQEVGDLIRLAHRRHRTSNIGFIRGLVTGNREPIAQTMFRALQSAKNRLPSNHPCLHNLNEVFGDLDGDDMNGSRSFSTKLLEATCYLAKESPLLLIIDEFGKNIEAIESENEADPFLLQQLAELGQGSGLPVFVLTLQHLSFENYQTHTETSKRNEWAKVQGRFEDIAYTESSHQLRSLIGTVFNVDSQELKNRINRWAKSQADSMRSLGLAEHADADMIASTYPLHPLTALILPDLCNRFGQNERTLFSYLTSPHTASATSFLASTKLPSRGRLPSLGLESLYDFFVSAEPQNASSLIGLQRLREIALRLRDLHGFSRDQMRLAKAVAILNLVSLGGTVRASYDLLSNICTNAKRALNHLENSGVITYRKFVDEFRIWQGTDVDVQQIVESSYERLSEKSLADILLSIDEPGAQIAARHSAINDILRIFVRRFAKGGEEVDPLSEFSPYDGQLLLVAGSDQALPVLAHSQNPKKPTVAAIPRNVEILNKVSREVAAITVALNHAEVSNDWVARSELTERLMESKTLLKRTILSSYSAEASRWFLLSAGGATELFSRRGSTALSEAADLTYPHSPSVGNEMLNRTELTSQGVRARRLLLEAMIERSDQVSLGLEGYGPEVAMYLSFLSRTGLHRKERGKSTYCFRAPKDDQLVPAWKAIQQLFKFAKSRRISGIEIYSVLLSPPFGMKLGAIPVLLTAALLAGSEEVAIYEHGTFKPLLTPELSERMVRNPAHFEFKHFANTIGSRKKVIDEFALRLGISSEKKKHRVGTTLSVVAQLVSRMRLLENYSRRTQELSSNTMEVREAISVAVEPDKLLFDALPSAVGLPPVEVDQASYRFVNEYVERVIKALQELTESYSNLLDSLYQFILDSCAESDRESISSQAGFISNEMLDPSVRAFVGTLANASIETNQDWTRTIATVVSNKAPSEWNDEDVLRFQHKLPQQVATFQRLVALHSDRSNESTVSLDVLRVIVSRLDGTEHIGLVQCDQSQRVLIDSALDVVLNGLYKSMGSRQQTHKALIAVLGARLLSEGSDFEESEHIERNTSNV